MKSILHLQITGGVRESFKTYIEDKYHDYFQKYKKEIFVDEGKRQREEFGVDIDEDMKTFYPKIGERVQNMTTEEQEEKLPFQELMEMRFEALYSMQLKGNWNKDLLVGLYKIEKAFKFLPDGHMLTNDQLRMISQEDFNGGNHGGYAWYSPNERRINFSSQAATSTGVWGRLHQSNEFESTMYHEIGHAVSQKLGGKHSLKYKYFVKECGWSYSQDEARSPKGMEATGDDRDVPRRGSRQNVPLLTDYAHKSPEEAFAEYYSIYANNKKDIDNFLKTGDEKHLEKKEFYGVKKGSWDSPKTVHETIPPHISLSSEKKYDIERSIRNLHLTEKDHIKIDLINPWHAKVHEQDLPNYSAREKVRNRKNWGVENMPPVIAVAHNGKYEIIDGVNRREQAKLNKYQLPAITISKEMYEKMTERGYNHSDLIAYAYDYHSMSHIPRPSEEAPQRIAGIDYRGTIIPSGKIKKSEKIFRRMHEIFNSDELQKAFDTLRFG